VFNNRISLLEAELADQKQKTEFAEEKLERTKKQYQEIMTRGNQ
jgi:flagellar biosynthesis chaperone FliJ